ncbi:hypothetical protein SLEP1_g53582 [Rubroshorea leprosula]|uniref:Uncharacterized protein n=1 Tax=Rubroshorea leprosula TaxID=152421 RepID=A0AAV5MCM0_9ROSI|nr:hypothetical protein SLEP1_g53582 [Rubroshorea leprosula]
MSLSWILYLVKVEDGYRYESVVGSVGLEGCVRIFAVFVKDAMAFSIAFKLCLVFSISCASLDTCDAIDRASGLDLIALLLEFALDEEEVLIPLLFLGF